MAETIGEAWVEIKPKTDNFGKDVEREVGGISQKLGSTFQKVGVGLTAAVTAPLIGLGAMAVKEATEARAGLAQMEAVIKSTGNAANLSGKEQVKLAESLGKLAGVEDDVVLAGQNMLRTFTGVRNEVGAGNDIFNQATLTALDMSAALGQDAKSSAIQLGKALNDPIQGVSALQRVGVTFTEAQKDQIKTMVEAGDTMGAQKLILAELNKEFGGSAKAQGDALGPMEKFKLTMADLGGKVGLVVLPFLDKLADKFEKVADWFGKLSPEGQKTVLWIAGIAAAIGPLLIVAGSLIRAVSSITSVVRLMNLAFLANPIVLIVAAIAALVAGFIYAYTHSEKFRDIVNGALRGVADFAGFVVSTIIKVLQTLVMFWLDSAGMILAAADKMLGWVPGLGPKLGAAKEAFEDFRADVNQKFDNAGEAAMRWGETTNKAADDTIATVDGKAPGAAAAGHRVGWGMGKAWHDAAKPGFDLTVTEAGGSVGAIAGLAGQAAAAGEGVGAAAAAGMVRGIRNGAWWVKQAATAVAGAALAAAKYTLSISSPSKVFEKEVGGGIVSGLVRGLMRGRGEAAAAASRLVGFGGLGGGLAGISRPTLAGAGGGGTATVVLQLDGRELGRVVTPYITDEQIVTGQRTQVGIFGGLA